MIILSQPPEYIQTRNICSLTSEFNKATATLHFTLFKKVIGRLVYFYN